VNTEADTCRRFIVPLLQRAGWDDAPSAINEQRTFTDGRVMFVGGVAKRGRRKRADYILHYRPDYPIAVIEAKVEYRSAQDGVQQARDYAEVLGLRFAYSSNGREIIEIDMTAGTERERADFPSPAELWERQSNQLHLGSAAAETTLLTPGFPDPERPPRYYQEIAVNRALEAITSGQTRALLNLCTGAGKTMVAFQICWRLWSAGWNKRGDHRKPKILFLADRNILIDDPKDKDFAPFRDARWKIEGQAVHSRDIYFSTYQAIAEDERRSGIYRDYAPDFFDLIIIDECHRGSARADSSWREILNWFAPAYKLGMTARPKVTLGEILIPATDRIRLEPDATYSQITARLWGKGLTLRGRLKGLEIAADQQMRVSAGQFLISKIDARHGAFGIVPEELAGAVVSNDFPVFDVSAGMALPEYIAWVGRTDWFVDLCRRASEGSTNRVRLKETRFLAQPIPLPPIEEQRCIVARLDAASAAVAARRSGADAVDAEIGATLRATFARITAQAPRARMGDVAPLFRRPVAIEPGATYPEIGVRSFGRGLFEKPDLKGEELTWQSLFRIELGDLVFSNIKAWEERSLLPSPSITVNTARIATSRASPILTGRPPHFSGSTCKAKRACFRLARPRLEAPTATGRSQPNGWQRLPSRCLRSTLNAGSTASKPWPASLAPLKQTPQPNWIDSCQLYCTKPLHELWTYSRPDKSP
jgi:hypothetical protein